MFHPSYTLDKFVILQMSTKVKYHVFRVTLSLQQEYAKIKQITTGAVDMADDLSFDILAASLRQDTSDILTFLEVLAKKLEAAIPLQTTVDRRGGLFSKTKSVHAIRIQAGEWLYILTQDHGRIDAQRVKMVRGIALKTESGSLSQWIEWVSQELLKLASESSDVRTGLERFLLS
ncbi:MAG: hypothetical protein M1499_09305 [Firmicutes bacterium]|nr:hypothetical protein [Bacillota bacterium]